MENSDSGFDESDAIAGFFETFSNELIGLEIDREVTSDKREREREEKWSLWEMERA